MSYMLSGRIDVLITFTMYKAPSLQTMQRRGLFFVPNVIWETQYKILSAIVDKKLLQIILYSGILNLRHKHKYIYDNFLSHKYVIFTFCVKMHALIRMLV